MTAMSAITGKSLPRSVLLISPSTDFASTLADGLGVRRERRVETHTAGLDHLNGHAGDLFSGHDVVVFDLREGSDAGLASVARVIAETGNGGIFLAIASEHLSIAEAQKLTRSGIREVIPGTVGGAELDRILERHLASGPAPQGAIPGGRPAEIIAIAKARGGVGATTVAVNLARKLCGGGGLLRKSTAHRVALLDLDLQFGNANAFLDLEDNGALLDLLQSNHSPDASYLRGMMQTHPNGPDLLSAPAPLVPLNSMTAALAGKLLDGLQAEYDFVVIDMPQALVEWISAVFARADRLLMVADTTVPSIRQAKRLIEFYQEENAGLQVDIVINRESKPMMNTSHVKDAESALGARLDLWLPDAPSDARRAADLGKPIVDLYPNSKLGKAYGKLGEAMSAGASSPAYQPA